MEHQQTPFSFGVIENRQDPEQLGRYQVRIVGLHTHDKTLLPTEALPWAITVNPVTSASMNGIGENPNLVEGTLVLVSFIDMETKQQPFIIGTMAQKSVSPQPVKDVPIPLAPLKEEKLETMETHPNVYTIVFKNSPYYLPDVLGINYTVIGNGIRDNTYIKQVESDRITISRPHDLKQTEELTFESPRGEIRDIINTEDGIPRTPPRGSTDNVFEATNGIRFLLEACDEVGLTTREQKSALLGIVGGESKWVPAEENHRYTPGNLKQTFPDATPAEIERYSNGKTTKEEFFAWVYGKRLGNENAEDGSRFYGRGYIQLTGRENYEKYSELANEIGYTENLAENPDLLITNPKYSAIIAALYLRDRVSSRKALPKDHPGYFLAANREVGGAASLNKLKEIYYLYFYGQHTQIVLKTTEPLPPPLIPEPKNLSPEDTGFRDPNGKYPLPAYENEPHISRNARGIRQGTNYEMKSKSRHTEIPRPMGLGNWDQPEIPYGAQYPFNQVRETESGHVIEYDDTPGRERISEFHKSGTFTETDVNGSRVNYIVGDNFTIVENNGAVHIAGECVITVDGDTNIYARSNANVEVAGNANLKVNRSIKADVNENMELKVGRRFSLNADTIEMKSNNRTVINGSDVDINAEKEFKLDYGKGYITSSVKPKKIYTTPPSLASSGQGLFVQKKFIESPSYLDEIEFETPDEWNTKEGRFEMNNMRRTMDISNDDFFMSPTENKTDKINQPTYQFEPDCNIINGIETFTNNISLSENFTMGMLVDGGVNGKHRLQDQRGLTKQQIVCNLSHLCYNVLEPLLENAVLPGGIFGYNRSWKITSGYRQQRNNSRSQHCLGQAVDIVILGNGFVESSDLTWNKIKEIAATVPTDQLILEYRYPRSVWIHISYKKSLRGQQFTMLNDRKITDGFQLVTRLSSNIT